MGNALSYTFFSRINNYNKANNQHGGAYTSYLIKLVFKDARKAEKFQSGIASIVSSLPHTGVTEHGVTWKLHG